MGDWQVTECATCIQKDLFYGLPSRLRSTGLITDEASTDETARTILLCEDEGKHFRLFICSDGAEELPACRCALTWRDGWEVAHIGFYESDRNAEASKALLSHVCEEARAAGFSSVMGPVNGSFWDGYRYKVAGFDMSYTCDRDTPRDYPALWEAAGFSVMRTWHSDIIPAVLGGRPKAKLELRLAQFEERGYRFEYMGRDGFTHGLSVLWELIEETYSSFVAYEPISEDGFKRRFRRLSGFLDPRCALLAYDPSGSPAGFGIAIPDYAFVAENAKGRIAKAVAAIRNRFRPERYVVAYVGVRDGHEGLGSALCAQMARRQEEVHATGVAALIEDGKITGSYAGEQGIRHWEYALYGMMSQTETDKE